MNAQQNAPNIVGRYAQLQVLAENLSANRKPVPSHVIKEMQQIEGWARVRLSPQQLEAALHHVEVAKMSYREQVQQVTGAMQEQKVQRDMNAMMQKLTGGMLDRAEGLTPAQVREVAAGKRLAGDAPLSQEQRDAHFKDRSRSMDPNGIGWSEAEYERRMDALADASPEQFDAIAKNYRADPRALKRAADAWSADRVEYGVMRRRSETDNRGSISSHDRAPNDDEQRRAAVVGAFLDKSADAMDSEAYQGRSDYTNQINDRVPESVINESTDSGEPTRRADIARAMVSTAGEE